MTADGPIFEKFVVRRTDGRDGQDGPHQGCEYFVLDATHDPHAAVALRAYATSCRATHPELADNLIDLALRFQGRAQPAEPVTHEFVPYRANPHICSVCGAVRPLPCYEIEAAP